MNVLHLWKSDSATYGAGGAVAMSRLHEGLITAGIDSNILCEYKVADSKRISTISKPNRWEKRLRKLTSKLGLNDIHRLSSFRLHQHPSFKRADVITIHGTHHAFMNYLAIPKLTRLKPTVFVLHDMWALTGHCTYSYDCTRWKSGCGQCPQLDTPPAVMRDSTHLEWVLKKWVYSKSDLSIISPSTMLAEQARQSLLKDFFIEHIPHGLDTHIYQPGNKHECRVYLGLPDDKFIVMFAAVNNKEKRKGGDLLKAALEHIPAAMRNEIVLLTMGKSADELGDQVGLPVHNMGYIESDTIKASIYSAADIFVSPTRGEAFGLMILESIACGTPVVAFGVGGVLDLVMDGVSGYRAEPENSLDLSTGIQRLLNDDEKRVKMSLRGVDMVHDQYTIDKQIDRYIHHYERRMAS